MNTYFRYSKSFEITTFITFILLTLFVAFTFNVQGQTVAKAEIKYIAAENAFKAEITPEANALVALYYKNSTGKINAVFGSNQTALPAKTCSGEECVNDIVTYGVMKVFIPLDKTVSATRFKIENGEAVILREAFATNITSTVLTAHDNPVLQLSAIDDAWLKNPTETTPTVTLTPTQTQTATVTVSPTKTVTPTPTSSPAPTTAPAACTDGISWVSNSPSRLQGKQRSGLPVEAGRSLSSNAFGEADNLFYSLGVTGWITFKFNGNINNVPGADLSIYEVTHNDRFLYLEEYARVEVSQDGLNWYGLSKHASSKVNALGISYMDFQETGLQTIQYVRLTNIDNVLDRVSQSDGFDLNAIQATSQSCPVVTTPTPTPTNAPSPQLTPPATIDNVLMITTGCYLGSDLCYPIVVLLGTNLGNANQVRASWVGNEREGMFFSDELGIEITAGFQELPVNQTFDIVVNFNDGSTLRKVNAFSTSL